MAPLNGTFDVSRLDQQVQIQTNGKKRKNPVDLKECALKELIQYDCQLAGPKEDPRSRVTCKPVLRLFRQCADGLTVETTSWEGVHDQ
ncbi:Hypothetical protein R9X50_00408500 [Acrodontium crateriforme]|uniref:Uncharacterized protein n=1 Tax=Acrodontium crateriforme TaxID=150365 RepID=A0AAQ3M4S9_9PEZI|nr:Hypothetical protein R9X50_00408500 [Acrodontium crateriforme]